VSERLANEDGFTLIELLLVCVLMIVVLGATLTTLSSFQTNASVNERQNDAQDEARRSIDGLARELRNLASPVNYDPDAIKRFEADDLIVQSVGETRPPGSSNSRNTQYVRYCYDQANDVVYRQELTWTSSTAPDVPGATPCPGDGWGNQQVVAGEITNDARPLFTYNGATARTITEIHASLFVDLERSARPKETSVETTVFLRNQNRNPIARFTAAPTADGAILLNGSESEDPEERALTYFWYDADRSNLLVGQGIVYSYLPPSRGPRRVFLRVEDPAKLDSSAPIQTVCVPGGGFTCVDD
jgi:type II secretory pathway pseudopilin PulG